VLNLIDELGTAEERRMNQLSTAEFGAAKVRHKFGRACRIMRIGATLIHTPLHSCAKLNSTLV
jgi:hypothetical protein